MTATAPVATARRRRYAVRWTAVVAVIATATVTAVVLMRGSNTSGTHALCAEVHDSLGLYQGAPVTIRGIEIGTVTALQPDGGHVRIDMRIGRRDLPADVHAVVVSNSILTDRRVELVGADARPGPLLSANTCIHPPMTATPVGINDALQAFSTLATQLSAPTADGGRSLRDLLNRLGRELDGTGPTINGTLTDLATVTASPQEFLTQLRRILDNLATLSTSAARGWPELKLTLPDLGPAFAVAADLLALFPPLISSFSAADAPLTRLLTEHLPKLTPLIEAAIPIIDQVDNHVENGKQLLDKIPTIVTLLQNMFDKQGAMAVTYAPPRFTVHTPSPNAICAQLNATRAGACEPVAIDRASVPLIQMVLSAIGGHS
ncbi:MCE family protein [Nocardia vaccinii]|uniref:MCE family protein n=1 Tax=Nocardia vaccinii TaxID=1822 RepID=UPI000A06BD04|nr:MCE family protein [Nocardia vaccinii]